MIRLVLLLVLCAVPASAQTLRLAISDPVIGLNPNYVGAPISLFGSVEDCSCAAADYEVAVSVLGPPRARMVTLKGRSASGMIATQERAWYNKLPSIYFLLTNRPASRILPDDAEDTHFLAPLEQIHLARVDGPDAPDKFDAALLEQLEARQEYGADSRAVTFVGPRFFSARFRLPSSALAGPYIAYVSLIQDGKVVATASQAFVIRTTGFEAGLIGLVHGNPALYGLVCIVVALGTGWIGGVVFRR